MNYHIFISVSEHLFPHIRCCRTYCVSSIVSRWQLFKNCSSKPPSSTLTCRHQIQYVHIRTILKFTHWYPRVQTQWVVVATSSCFLGQALSKLCKHSEITARRCYITSLKVCIRSVLPQLALRQMKIQISTHLYVAPLIPLLKTLIKPYNIVVLLQLDVQYNLKDNLHCQEQHLLLNSWLDWCSQKGPLVLHSKPSQSAGDSSSHLSKERPLSQWHGERAALGMKVTCLGRSNSTEFRRARTPDARPLSMYQSTRLSGTLQRDVRTEQQAEIAFRQRYGLVAPSSILTRVCAYFGFVLASYSQLIIEFIILPLDRLAIVANQCDNSGCFLTEFPRPLLSRYSLPSMQQVAKLSKGLGLKCSPLLNEIAATSRFSCCESSLGNAFIEVQLLCKGAIKTIYEGIMQLHTDNNRGIRLNRREVQIAILMKNRLHVKNFISMELDCESERYGPITKERIRQLLVFSRDVRMIFEPQTARSILFGSETLIDPVSSTDLLVGFMARNDRTELDQLKIATIRLLADIDDISALEDVHDAFYRAVIECGPATCVLSMFE
uniref:Uncharacterized protein n=1 Tax=Spironucleus salmonicida TaxID=348837 RepID=V6LVH2_9EUKA|eukprot:EST47681.1 Hypothetical protein SS50377_12237 [Spironucleus salmonicida]